MNRVLLPALLLLTGILTWQLAPRLLSHEAPISLAPQQPEAATRSPSDDRLPPLGWENRITEGFDPPIEYVVAIELYTPFGSMVTNEQLQRYLSDWGDEALPVLRRMADESFWKAHRTEIFGLLKLSDAEPDWDASERRLIELIAKSDPPDDEKKECYAILSAIGKSSGDRAAEILEKVAGKASAPYLHAVLSAIAKVGTQERLDILERLHNTLTDPEHQKSIAYYLEEVSGKLRAQQPMKDSAGA